MDGGAIVEPMLDLITILGTMVDKSGCVCIPGFNEDIRPLTDTERAFLHGVEFDVAGYHRRTGVG